MALKWIACLDHSGHDAAGCEAQRKIVKYLQRVAWGEPPSARMTTRGRGLLPLVLVCAVLVVGARESRIHRHRVRTSWSRPHQTHRLAATATTTTTTASKDTTIPFITSNHHRNNHHRQHHYHNNKHHRFFSSSSSSNNNHNHHRNSTRGHRTSIRYHIFPDANHSQRRHNQHHNRNHLTTSNHRYHHHGNNTTRNNYSGRRNHQHHHHHYNNKKHNQGSHNRRKHHNHHHHFRNHISKLLANQDFPKQSIKRHLGGMKRQSHHHTPFLQPMRMHTSFRSALADGLSFHRHPQLWDMSRLRNHHQRIMHHLSSRLRDHMMKMRSRSVPHVASSHHRHFSHHHPSHNFYSGQQVHCRHNQPRHHGTRAEDSARLGTQFKIALGEHGSVPEDVEVFRWPVIPQSSPQPTTTTATTTTTPRPIIIEDNTRKVTNSNPHPQNAGSSRGRPSYQPPSPPTHPILNTLFPSPTPSTPAWEGRGAGESGGGGSRTTTSVQDHLSQSPHSRPTAADPTTIPCIKCPPDTRVQAPRGRDCVYARTPSPLPCTTQWNPDVQTIVTEGPSPGTRLQEGHYAISFTVVVMEGESRGATPIATCRIGYDVEVRKCPELPRRAGLEARCSAGRAWGSRCTWRCSGNLQLRGAASTTCSGYRHPRWTHEPPSCVAPPTPAPHSPPVSRGCKAPPDVPGGHYSCWVPVGRPVVPIPKDDPSAPRSPRETNSAHHAEGTVCELNCGHGRTIAVSQRGRRRLTCTPGGHWDHRPPSCRLQVSPVLQDGDCKDTTLKPPHSPLSFLPLPNFRTSSGVAARVTCVLEARSEGSHTRTCTAEDPELETATHCKYRITLLDAAPDPDAVLLPGLSGRAGTSHNPVEEAGHQAGGDDEWEAERQHPDNEHGDSTGQRRDLYPYRSKEDSDDDYYDYDDEDEDEFDYYYDGSDLDDGDFIDDYSDEFETVPELQRVQGQILGTGSKRRGSSSSSHGRRRKKHKVNWAARNSTRRRSKTTKKQRKTKKTSLSTSFSPSSSSYSLNPPSPSYSNRKSTVVAKDVMTGGENSEAAMPEGAGDAQQVNVKGSLAHHIISGRQNREKTHHTHQRKHLSGERSSPNNLQKYTVKTNENGTLTQKGDWRKSAQLTSSPPPADEGRSSGGRGQGTQPIPPLDKEGIPATMEAVVRMEVTVGSCGVGREVARVLGKALKDQELCGTGLTCHNPRHTCTETRDRLTEGGRARVEVLWAVGGLYEYDEGNGSRPHPTPQYLPHHVPEVETAISAILESTRGILTSHSLAQSLAALGAEVDPSSFLVTQLDLVCRQPGLTLRTETNRCWPD
ncbi:uncharacterized protein LOC135099848 isoform X2 [Scylla paramamosain]|uniref:uncharacterized protein LOC135099848 isoform X2 n=2 Tax=Scylla paramamosain TaxID=85552 RepID=UPI003083A7C3